MEFDSDFSRKEHVLFRDSFTTIDDGIYSPTCPEFTSSQYMDLIYLYSEHQPFSFDISFLSVVNISQVSFIDC